MIRELDHNTIGPNMDDIYSKTQASKIIFLGKPGTGKSFAIKSLLFQMREKINQGVIINGTEDVNIAYGEHFPSLFVYNHYSEAAIRQLIAHQKMAIKNRVENPWSVLVIDDCSCDKKFFSSELQQQLFKNSRHWYILYILAIQYAKDVPPTIRSTVDGIFIFREHNMQTRKIIYENYASVIPSFKIFIEIMTLVTQNFRALFVDNMKSSDEWCESLATYKGEKTPDEWYFGDDEFWIFNNELLDD